MSSKLPNVVIVILDCVRASDFPGGSTPVGGTSFLDGLQKDCVVFSRSVSASSWTVPTHASILTGLYPNEHGAFSMGSGTLPENCLTLPEILRQEGYSTALISANHNLRPSLGFTRGFSRAWWAPWGVTSLRLGSRDEKPYSNDSANRVDWLRRNTFEQEARGIWKVWNALANNLPRHPWLLDGASRVIQSIRAGSGGYEGRVAPWVEPIFSKWLGQVPQSQPIFSLVNLMDAHEPYLPDAGKIKGLQDWWAKGQVRQDVNNWETGRWIPKANELRAIYDLYREKIRGLDGRVESLVQILVEAGRWEDTIFIITSDHGQAFGEGGYLFHGNSVEEALIRIPLWVRLPKGRAGGSVASVWTSSVDLMPIILEETLGHRTGVPPGLLVENIAQQSRTEPIYAMTGMRDLSNVKGSPAMMKRPGFLIAGYLDNLKCSIVVGDQSVQIQRFKGQTLAPIETDTDGVNAQKVLKAGVELMARRVLNPATAYEPPQQSQLHSAVEQKLRSWGY